MQKGETPMDIQSPEQMRRQALAIRQKLMGKPVNISQPKKIETVIIETKREPINYSVMWRVYELHFDAHVIEYRKLAHKAADLARQNEALREELKVYTQDFDFFMKPKKAAKDIIKETIQDLGVKVTYEEVMRRTRKANITETRHLCMYEVNRQRPDLSLPQIGKIFGGYDHTTVIFAINKVKATLGDQAAISYIENKSAKSQEWLADVKAGNRRKAPQKPS